MMSAKPFISITSDGVDKLRARVVPINPGSSGGAKRFQPGCHRAVPVVSLDRPSDQLRAAGACAAGYGI